MRTRPSARLIVLDCDNRVLLFRFALSNTRLRVTDYWATPGGSVEEGETYAEAARRELFEETGMRSAIGDTHAAEREFVLEMPDGEEVLAQERFFVAHVDAQMISTENWTALEKQIMVDHKWWPLEELKATPDVVFPENLVAIVKSIGVR